MTYPGTREVVYTFDRRFRMTGVSGGTGVGGTRGLDVADQVISSSFANGVSSVFDYDVNGRMTHMERFKNGAPPTMLVEYDYGYDAVGNRLYTRDLMATNRSELYGYDARNRLRNFERGTLNTAGDDISTPLVDPALPSQQQWTDLDRRGNWLDFSTTLNGQPAVQQTREANQVNEIMTLDPDGPGGGQSAVTLANDSNGNLTENPWAFNADDGGTPTGQKYEYDEENRLVRVKRLTSPADQVLLEIGYDAFGRRVESKEYLDAQTGQILSTPRVTHHVVLGPMTIEEYSITAGPTALLAREFVWGTEFPMPVAIVDWTAAGQVGTGQAEVLHYLRDVLGNVVALTNATGNVAERYRYDPYGMTRIYNAGGALLPTSAYGNPYAFTGQRYDAAVVLYHFWFRTYSPSLGRWHQRDPIGYIDGMSLYQYLVSGPLNGTDPLGLECRKRWSSEDEKKKALTEAIRSSKDLRDFVDTYDPTWNGAKGDELFNLEYRSVYGDTDIDWMITLLAAHYGRAGWFFRGMDPEDIYAIGKTFWIFYDAATDPNVSVDFSRYGQQNEINAIKAAQDLIQGKKTLRDLFPDLDYSDVTEGGQPNPPPWRIDPRPHRRGPRRVRTR
ncbi:MAG TPA: RHS repeat-associated core domain-containing protein [Phycisphaerae bacterium]|nr:RHS repeat-associated core domain-containing protein [Phycisphaerae bacterium]